MVWPLACPTWPTMARAPHAAANRIMERTEAIAEEDGGEGAAAAAAAGAALATITSIVAGVTLVWFFYGSMMRAANVLTQK